MQNDEFKNVIVFTGVYFQEDAIYQMRSKIWPKTIENAAKLGVKVIIRNDGGVSEEILSELKKYGNVTFVDKTEPATLGEGRRKIFKKGLDVAEMEGIENPVFLWTEPEKDGLITEENLSRIVREVENGSHIIVPERGEKAWTQLPKIQSFLENRAQGKVRDMLVSTSGNINQEILDLWFGPKVFDKTGADYFLKYNSEKNKIDLWDSLMVPVMEAVKDGVNVKSIPMDFLYNEEQIRVESDETNKEISIKRIEQYTQILKELGDPTWIEFFENSKNELEKIKEIKKDDKELNTTPAKEAKAGLMNKFWKLK